MHIICYAVYTIYANPFSIDNTHHCSLTLQGIVMSHLLGVVKMPAGIAVKLVVSQSVTIDAIY